MPRSWQRSYGRRSSRSMMDGKGRLHRKHPTSRGLPGDRGGGSSVREVLDNVFAANPQARAYVLDDQAALRRHMTVFVDGKPFATARGCPTRSPQTSARSTSSRLCREVDHEHCYPRFDPQGAVPAGARARAGASRRTDFLGDNVSLALTDPRERPPLCGARSRPLRRQAAPLDGDGTGRRSRRPAYPPKPEGLEENDMWGRPLAVEHDARIWALQAGGADEPGVIWCGTLPGGLFRSDDHGESWEMIRSLWDHPKRKSGWAAAPTCPASTRFWSIRAIRSGCGSRSRPAASGSRRMPARAGRSAARACAPSTCRRS